LMRPVAVRQSHLSHNARDIRHRLHCGFEAINIRISATSDRFSVRPWITYVSFMPHIVPEGESRVQRKITENIHVRYQRFLGVPSMP
jgi:alpha-D-ribose 1-methylphosphonate 5-triphosphate diphosphatase PhnM